MAAFHLYVRVFGIAMFAVLSGTAMTACIGNGANPGDGTPAIEQVTPDSGTPFGGTVIQVTGAGFALGDVVWVGKQACNSVKFVSAAELDCVTPQGPAGAVDVTVLRAGQLIASLNAGFSYGCVSPAPVGTVIWANSGEDKVPQDDLRAGCNPEAVKSRLWDGKTIRVFGARNEVVNFNLVIEAPSSGLKSVSVTFDTLNGPGGAKIVSSAASGDSLFNYTGRNIELFYVRYLKILGLSHISYEFYDEQQVPKKFQRKYEGNGNVASGADGKPLYGWTDRPDHDKYYPDIAVPIEAVGPFEVEGARSQSIWADIYIPRGATPGDYTGNVSIQVGTQAAILVPVKLTVRNMPALSDSPSAKTMVYLGYEDIGKRFFNKTDFTGDMTNGPKLDSIRDRYFQMAHRHKISLVDKNPGYNPWKLDQPQPAWIPRLNGSLFSSAQGYAGPGENVGNGVYSIGIYNSWTWAGGSKNDMWTHSNAWEDWFAANAPGVEHSLFLSDEATSDAQFNQIKTWTGWLKDPANPGSGKNLKTMVSGPILLAPSNGSTIEPVSPLVTSGIDIISSLIAVGDSTAWPATVGQFKSANPNAQFDLYNGKRPGSGTFATEDDGVSLRELAWGQYKHKIDRWFYWESSYYNNYQGVVRDTPKGDTPEWQTSLFQSAQTFGSVSIVDPVVGRTTDANTGLPYGNGDGVLFYPGTDLVTPNDSYNLNGPMASLRLKYWRRGIQDVDYLTMAAKINPTQVQQIVSQLIPSVLWEPGLSDKTQISSSRVAPTWSTAPDDWDSARDQLATIIENGN